MLASDRYSFEVSDRMCLDYWNKPQLAIEGPQSLEVKSHVDIQAYHSIILHSWKVLCWRAQDVEPASNSPSSPSRPQSPTRLQIEDSMEIDAPQLLAEKLPHPLKRKLVDDFCHKRFRPNSIWVN